jgi:hypothetical protein
MKKKKGKGIPAPSARRNSALLRMDRARGQKAGTSARQSRKIGSYNTLLIQHQIAQLNANQVSIAKSRGSK